MPNMKLNPKIREIEYGKSRLNQLTIYPLSLNDQFSVAEIISEVVARLETTASGSDIAAFNAFVSVVQVHAQKVLEIVTDLETPAVIQIMDEITNDQFLEFIEAVWEANYETTLKNGQSLFKKIQSQFQVPSQTSLKRSSPTSLNTIPNTPSTTSSPIVSDKEDLPLAKSKSSTKDQGKEGTQN